MRDNTKPNVPTNHSEFFNITKQVKCFGQVVDGSGHFPEKQLDEMLELKKEAKRSCINSNADNQSLEQLAKEAVERGNSIEIHRSKDGLKVFEVSKKLVKVIRS